jgi:hypothetical protein
MLSGRTQCGVRQDKRLKRSLRSSAFQFSSMGEYTPTINVAGDKHEFDPERWQTPKQLYHNGLGESAATGSTGLPKRYPETGIDVLIVGAGMGGLMTALECWRKGHNVVRILERNDGPVYSGMC